MRCRHTVTSNKLLSYHRLTLTAQGEVINAVHSVYVQGRVQLILLTHPQVISTTWWIHLYLTTPYSTVTTILLYNLVYRYTTWCTVIQPCVPLYNLVYRYTTLCTVIQPCVPLYNLVYLYTTLCTFIQPCVPLYNLVYLHVTVTP